MHRHIASLIMLCPVLACPYTAVHADSMDGAVAGQTYGENVILDLEAGMLTIPKGCFLMGSPADEPERDADEGPQRQVCLQAFQFARHEVTQGLWKAVMGENPAYFKAGDDHPVEMVSWHDVQQFLQRLNTLTGKQYRLPTEAEWEYAARAGSAEPFWWEMSREKGLFRAAEYVSHENANYGKIECCSGYATGRDQWEFTAPVGSFEASKYGVYDGRGNVWEWVQDCYTDSYAQLPTDGSAWEQGDCKYRVFRGGSWDNGPLKLRAANRSWDEPSYRFNGLGFRLAHSLAR